MPSLFNRARALFFRARADWRLLTALAPTGVAARVICAPQTGASGALCSRTVFCRESGTRSSALWIITVVLWMKLLVVCCDSALWRAREEPDQFGHRRDAHPEKKKLIRGRLGQGEQLSGWRSLFRRFASGAAGEDGAPASQTSGAVLVVDQPPASMPSRRRRLRFAGGRPR